MGRSYIPIFLDWTEVTEGLNDQEKGRLIDAMVLYARGGDWAEKLKGAERILFPAFRAQIDRSGDISAKRKAAGSIGGSSNKANGSKIKQTEANVSKTSKPKQTEAKKKNNNKEEEVKEEESAATTTTAAALSDEQVDEYRQMQDTLFEKAEQIGLSLSSDIMQKLIDAAADYGQDRVLYALTEASECGVVNWRYISTILKAPKQKQQPVATVDDEFAGMTRW